MPSPQTNRNVSPLQANYFQSASSAGHDPFAQVSTGQHPPSIAPTFVSPQTATHVGNGAPAAPNVTTYTSLPPASSATGGKYLTFSTAAVVNECVYCFYCVALSNSFNLILVMCLTFINTTTKC